MTEHYLLRPNQDTLPMQFMNGHGPQVASDNRLLRMIDDMPVAVMTVDPETCVITYVNEMSRRLIRSIEHLLPITADDLIGTSIDVFHKEPQHQRQILSDASNLPHNARIKLGQEILDLKVSAINANDGSYLGPMLTWAIVTNEVEAEKRTHQIARFDALTNLSNRAAFNEELAKRLENTDEGSTLLYVDLDGFKLVNDTGGHRAGDDLLRVVANRLRKVCSSPGTTIGRLGGDEFAILIAGNDESRAKQLSDQIIGAISSLHNADYQSRVGINASVGIAMAPDHGCDSAALLARADIAMYAAKAAGKGRHKIFSADMEARILDRFHLQTQLDDSLRYNDGLYVFYQPIVNPRTKQVTCREALTRWHRPARGWISPTEFIPIAEQGGLIDRLGAFVLNRACREAVQWHDDSRVAVNVSASQLGKGTIVEAVQTALEGSGLQVDRLEIEVTETAMLENENGAISELLELHEMGVRVALDDFGTGYSSLTHLCSFPYDKIKIDGSFVKDAVNRREAAAVVRAVADLGHRLGVTTVAEGVETEAHLNRILDEGCSEVQGYYFGKPKPSPRDAVIVAKLDASGLRRSF